MDIVKFVPTRMKFVTDNHEVAVFRSQHRIYDNEVAEGHWYQYYIVGKNIGDRRELFYFMPLVPYDEVPTHFRTTFVGSTPCTPQYSQVVNMHNLPIGSPFTVRSNDSMHGSVKGITDMIVRQREAQDAIRKANGYAIKF